MLKDISKFIEEVCSQVKYKKAHGLISQELSSHIYELMDSYVETGMTEEEAAEKAVEQMGSPLDIGKGLHKAHKPKTEWSLIVLISTIIIMGMVVLFSIARDPAFFTMDVNRFLKTYSVYAGLGVLIFCICYFFDYTKLEKYSIYIYVGTLILLYIPILSHNTINGISVIMIGGFRIKPVSFILPLFLVSFAGLINKWGKGDIKGMLKLLGAAGVAIVMCMLQPSFANAMLLGCGFLVLITKSIINEKFKGNRKGFLLSIYSGGILGTLLLLLTAKDYQISRLKVFLNPNLDPLGRGYYNYMIQKVFEGAKLLGKGEGLYMSRNGLNDAFALPEANTDFIFTYMVSAFGWIVGIALIVVLSLTVIRMVLATQKIHTSYGGYITSAIVTVFTLQIIINILMNFGLFPYTGVSLPFVSYGGANFVSNMALIGLFLGVYRRRNLVPEVSNTMPSR